MRLTCGLDATPEPSRRRARHSPLSRSRASVDPLPLLHRCRPGLPALFSLADGACSSLLARTFSGEIPPGARGERK